MAEISDKAKNAAERLIQDLKSGKIKKNILPDNSMRYTPEQELQDHIRYLEFTKTSLFQRIIEM